MSRNMSPLSDWCSSHLVPTCRWCLFPWYTSRLSLCSLSSVWTSERMMLTSYESLIPRGKGSSAPISHSSCNLGSTTRETRIVIKQNRVKETNVQLWPLKLATRCQRCQSPKTKQQLPSDAIHYAIQRSKKQQ